MTMAPHERLAALRHAFEDAFAAAPPADPPPRDTWLVLWAGPERLALRLADLAGLARLAAVVPLPGAPPAALGVASMRGRTVAVFDLAMLRGWPAGGGPPRWMALLARAPDVALAFGRVEGQVSADPGEAAPGLVDVDAILAALAAAAGAARDGRRTP